MESLESIVIKERRRLQFGFLPLLLGLGLAVTSRGTIARAGGGPQNLFLVVNPRSSASLAIANHYIASEHSGE